MTWTLTVAAVLLMTCGAVWAADDSGMVARWAFDEGSGNTLHDRSGNNHHGALHNVAWVRTESGGALRFNGSDSYVDCGEVPDLNATGEVTIMTWVKIMAPSFPAYGTNWVIVGNEVFNNSGFLMRVEGSLAQLYYRANREGAYYGAYARAPLSNDTFHHLVVVKRGKEVTAYVDGIPEVLSRSFLAPLPATGHLTISAPEQSFDGLMDEMIIYRRALTLGEVLEDYRRGAAAHGKDTSWFGKIRLTPFHYFDEKQTVVEADFLGVLPVTERDEVTVELCPDGKEPSEVRRVVIASDLVKSDFAFSLANLPSGRHRIQAVVRANGKVTTETHIDFDYPPPPLVPSPEQWIVAALPPPSESVPYRVSLANAGGFALIINNETYPVESSFSYPHGGENRLSSSEDNSLGEKSWRVVSRNINDSTCEVQAEGKYYRIQRRIHLHPNRIAIADTLTNLSAEAIGIVLSHELKTTGNNINEAFVSGFRTTAPVREKSLQINPTLFLRKRGLGLGLIALDDVFIVQCLGSFDATGSHLGSRTFALEAGASYTLEWAIYLTSSGDYYDFINEVRQDEGRNNVTVEGGFAILSSGDRRAIPSREFMEWRNLKYVCGYNLIAPADDPAVHLEGIEFMEYPKEMRLLKEQFEALRKMNPDRNLKLMFHIAPNLYATNKPNQKFPDSHIIERNGKQAVFSLGGKPYTGYFSKQRIDEGWRFYLYYPALDNSFGDAFLKSAEVLTDEIGATGAFIDGLLWCGDEDWPAYTYDRWDGHSAEIDPATKTIRRKMGNRLLLSQPAIVAFVRRINAKGGVVIANNSTITRTLGKERILHEKEIAGGPYVHLAPTPIAMTNAAACAGSEVGVYEDVHQKLLWGNLYFFHDEGAKTLTHLSAPARFYPITVQEIHSGCVKGKERIITNRSGVYGWRGDKELHFTHRFDTRGREIPSAFLTTVDESGVRTQVDLQYKQMAIVKKIPVFIKSRSLQHHGNRDKSAQPLNLISRQYDHKALRLILNGRGKTEVVVHDGEFAIKPGARYRVRVGADWNIVSEAKGILTFAVELKGQSDVTIEPTE